jgi:hypothetical protein
LESLLLKMLPAMQRKFGRVIPFISLKIKGKINPPEQKNKLQEDQMGIDKLAHIRNFNPVPQIRTPGFETVSSVFGTIMLPG